MTIGCNWSKRLGVILKNYNKILMYLGTDTMYLGSSLWYRLPFSNDGKLRTRDYFLLFRGSCVYLLGGWILSTPLFHHEDPIVLFLYLPLPPLLGDNLVLSVLPPSSRYPRGLAYESCSRNVFKMKIWTREKRNPCQPAPDTFPLIDIHLFH